MRKKNQNQFQPKQVRIRPQIKRQPIQRSLGVWEGFERAGQVLDSLGNDAMDLV